MELLLKSVYASRTLRDESFIGLGFRPRIGFGCTKSVS